MFNSFLYILVIQFLVLLSGCSISISNVANDVDGMTFNAMPTADMEWINNNKSEISKKIISFVKERHPDKDNTFPQIDIIEIQVARRWEDTYTYISKEDKEVVNEMREVSLPWRRFEDDLKEIAENVASSLILKSDISEKWKAKLKIAFLEPESDDLDIALAAIALLPRMSVCYGSLFLVCPISGKHVTLIEMIVEDESDNSYLLYGVGLSKLFQQTVISNDNTSSDLYGINESYAKSLAAAVASSSDKLVELDKIKKDKKVSKDVEK